MKSDKLKLPICTETNGGEKGRRKFGEEFGESSEKILEMILGNKNISAQEIAKHRGISSRAVEKQIAKLKKYGVLKRMGSAKGGRWEVKI